MSKPNRKSLALKSMSRDALASVAGGDTWWDQARDKKGMFYQPQPSFNTNPFAGWTPTPIYRTW